MGKNKFIIKKKSATFQLLARDSSDPNYDVGPSGDRVFVRIDNNPYAIDGFLDEGGDNFEDGVIPDFRSGSHIAEDPDSIFADAPDEDDDENEIPKYQFGTPSTTAKPLPDHIRKEILELGFPDDGYNYLLHLREIKNTGGGSSYYQNSKAKLDQLPLDVKAYDASRVRVSRSDGDSNENSIYGVASRTVGVKVQKAVDPEVVALLDDSDLSRFGSDVEDLEEDFVVQANILEQDCDIIDDKKSNCFEQPEIINEECSNDPIFAIEEHKANFSGSGVLKNHQLEEANECVNDRPRVRRLLDEQFDMLTLQEYGSDSDFPDDCSTAEQSEPLVNRINHVLKDRPIDELEVDNRYQAPADILLSEGVDNEELLDSAADLIRRCAEYGEMYSNEIQDDKEVVFEESSDESELWDCETIVSTYSNLDNLPGKIDAPAQTRKKKLTESVFRAFNASTNVITLRGKEKLPVEFLPQSKKSAPEKVKEAPKSRSEQQKRKPHGQESKEEKKERKAAVKEERREARQAKKEMKGLYKGEAHRAQKVAAISGPQSIHLM